jgi:uncharacterized membrane protein
MVQRGRCFKVSLFILLLVWTLLLFIIPLYSPVKDLSGHVLLLDNYADNPIYFAGDILCHQIAERSLFINGKQMPFCARCTAIWIGLTLGSGLMIFRRVNLDGRCLGWVLLGISPLAVDGIGQLFNLWVSTNLVRFITGLLAGCVCGVALGAIIDEIKLKSTKSKRIQF